jgi:hypothetical protein
MTSKVGKEMRDVLSRIADQNEARRAARKQAAVPKVGIFFVVGKQLWIDGTPVTEAQAYGGMKTHEKGHDVFWEQLQEANTVGWDIEYIEIPRGRVCYSVDKREFYLLVDPCIKKDSEMIERIMDEMNLPSATRVELDSHYRCPGCMPHSEE